VAQRGVHALTGVVDERPATRDEGSSRREQLRATPTEVSSSLEEMSSREEAGDVLAERGVIEASSRDSA
jgi:hypothetical protein